MTTRNPNHKPYLPVRDAAFDRILEADTAAKPHWSWRPTRKRARRRAKVNLADVVL